MGILTSVDVLWTDAVMYPAHLLIRSLTEAQQVPLLLPQVARCPVFFASY